MGIRIHKMIGYGLTNVHYKKYKITDKRFSKQWLENEDGQEFDREAYVKWLKEKLAEYPEGYEDRSFDYNKKSAIQMEIRFFQNDERAKRLDYYDTFVHQAEFGDPKVFCVVPFCEVSQWKRYDDIIDYTEECSSYAEGACIKVRKLFGGIYPYIGTLMDSRDGRKIPQTGVTYSMLVDKKSPLDHDSIIKLTGFETIKEVRSYLKPYIPEPIQLLCEYSGIFSDPKVVFQLVPILYIYWS
jgi:hypothetical protein